MHALALHTRIGMYRGVFGSEEMGRHRGLPEVQTAELDICAAFVFRHINIIAKPCTREQWRDTDTVCPNSKCTLGPPFRRQLQRAGETGRGRRRGRDKESVANRQRLSLMGWGLVNRKRATRQGYCKECVAQRGHLLQKRCLMAEMGK